MYAFRSKDRINNETLTLLLNKENCLTKCLYKAISSPFNSIEFVNNDATYNYNNVVGDLVSTFATDVKYLKDKDAEEKVAELLMMMISNNTEQ